MGTVDVADTPNEQNKYPCYSKPSDYQSQKSKIMKTEILIKMRESLFWKRSFVCLAAGDKFIQGLKVRQEKKPYICTQTECWTMHSNPVQTGVSAHSI